LIAVPRKHAVGLPPVMNLMLKQMHQQTIVPFGLYPRITIDLHHFVETVCGQTPADLDKALIDGGLIEAKIGNCAGPTRESENGGIVRVSRNFDFP
jgi:hypothetical protein